jgi:hypothetical protein
MELGLDKDSNLVYEGSGRWGHAIWPTPIILPLAFTTSENIDIAAEDGSLILAVTSSVKMPSIQSVALDTAGYIKCMIANSLSGMSVFIRRDRMRRGKWAGVYWLSTCVPFILLVSLILLAPWVMLSQS